jgi:hypothetical protein
MVGLHPVLTTVVVADDLIGPFSMYIDAGPGLMDNLRAGWAAASYGHFNYLGQLIGGFINWAWMQLMINGIRFSTIYYFSKLFVFILVVFASCSAITSLARLWGDQIEVQKLRVFVALAMIATFQLHLVWSNDPVASYPMSGYASVVVGLWALKFAAIALQDPESIRKAVLASTSFLCAVLYYEMNVALVPAIAILAVSYVISESTRRKNTMRTLFRTSLVYVIPGLLVLELQRQNAIESIAYDGTAIRYSNEFFGTFFRLMASSLPYSSWHLASDWVVNFPSPDKHIRLFVVFILLALFSFWYSSRRMKRNSNFHWFWWSCPVLFTYWAAATAIQSSTIKVQNEATRIGYVYNFYAIGSLAVSILLAFLMYIFFSRVRRLIVRLPFLAVVVILCLGQIHVNESIQEKHFNMLPQSRNLLVSFTERWPIESRCGWLEEWLRMGWPIYYSNAMASGLERVYLNEFSEPFCGRF